MSKSLKRVRAALEAAQIATEIRETGNARTAEDAAAAVGCALNQIVKSIVFQAREGDALALFLTAGGNQVDPEAATALFGTPLTRTDADTVRQKTGFAIGGVAPVGHLSPITCFLDPALMDFPVVWAAAGTPRHVFAIAPGQLHDLTSAHIADFVKSG
ncbi:YbaK/EbsC family protein [Ruegeria pomeroyi]|nr:YbaK/EbsC family protein [Ruegeria pomeroyi]